MLRAMLWAGGAVAAAAVVLGFVLIGSPPAVHGTIATKRYVPARTKLVWLPRYETTCHEQEAEEPEYVDGHVEEELREEDECTQTQIGLRLVPQRTAACWQLTVSGPQGGTVCASASQYVAAKIGGQW